MTFPVPPVNVNPTTDVNMNDSCNCCIPSKKKPKKPANTAQMALDTLSDQLANPARDANEVYNLHLSVDYRSRKNSDDSNEKPNHTRQITKYPKDEKQTHSTPSLHTKDKGKK